MAARSARRPAPGDGSTSIRRGGSPLAVAAKEGRDNAAIAAKIGARFAGFRPALEILTPVRVVPTVFPSLDLETKVGGWPVERVTLVHGPSNEGKTLFLLGLGLSFLRRGHFYAHVDAERTTPDDWIRGMLGQYATSPLFHAMRPRTYEEARDAVRSWAETIGESKSKGELDADTSGLCVIDSLDALMPKGEFDALMREAEEEAGEPRRGKSWGRGEQRKAKMTAAWCRELVSLLAETGTGIAIIPREIANADAGLFERDWKITGGRHLFSDASLDARVLLKGQVWADPNDKSRGVLGERHAVEIRKTKIGRKEEKVPEAFFHASNGRVGPEGIDVARDLVEVGEGLGVVRKSGAWFSFGDDRIGQGRNNAVEYLYAHLDVLAALDAAVRTQVEQVLDAERAARRPAAE